MFSRRPDNNAFSRDDVLAFERHPVKSGTQTVTVLLPDGPEPAFAGIDPYLKRIDRNADDNITSVQMIDGN